MKYLYEAVRDAVAAEPDIASKVLLDITDHEGYMPDLKAMAPPGRGAGCGITYVVPNQALAWIIRQFVDVYRITIGIHRSIDVVDAIPTEGAFDIVTASTLFNRLTVVEAQDAVLDAKAVLNVGGKLIMGLREDTAPATYIQIRDWLRGNGFDVPDSPDAFDPGDGIQRAVITAVRTT